MAPVMQMGCSRLRGTCNMGSDTISVFHSCDMQDIADKHPPQLPAMLNALAPLLPRSPAPLVTLPGLQSWSSPQYSMVTLSTLPLLLREEIPPAGMMKLPSPLRMGLSVSP